MKIIYFTFCLAILFFTTSAYAQLNYYRPGEVKSKQSVIENKNSSSRTLIITPIENCYANLSKEDVEDITNNYMKPYRECLKRVANKPRKKIGSSKSTTSVEEKNIKEKEGAK